MPSARTLSPDELSLATDTLVYEINMFVSTARMLAAWPLGPGDLHNAVLESFLVHFRQIIEFLAETDDGRKRVGQSGGRDVRAIHFCAAARRVAWEDRAKQHHADLVKSDVEGAQVKDDIDRQVVHLTAQRGGPYKTPWPYHGWRRDILVRLDDWVRNYATELRPDVASGIAALASSGQANPGGLPAQSSAASGI